MPRLVILTPALADLADIRRYIAKASHSIGRAAQFTDRLRNRCRRIAALPGQQGRDRSELMPGVRSVAERGYVILFRYADTRLEVIRILHGARDLPAILNQPDES